MVLNVSVWVQDRAVSFHDCRSYECSRLSACRRWEDEPLFAGPIIARELVTTPRPWRYYLWRASFACALFILLWTAWQSIIGWQDVRELGVLARFGGVLYVMFALLQLTLMLFFCPTFHRSRGCLRKGSPHVQPLAHDQPE